MFLSVILNHQTPSNVSFTWLSTFDCDCTNYGNWSPRYSLEWLAFTYLTPRMYFCCACTSITLDLSHIASRSFTLLKTLSWSRLYHIIYTHTPGPISRYLTWSNFFHLSSSGSSWIATQSHRHHHHLHPSGLPKVALIFFSAWVGLHMTGLLLVLAVVGGLVVKFSGQRLGG